jgi:hypothetical protein
LLLLGALLGIAANNGQQERDKNEVFDHWFWCSCAVTGAVAGIGAGVDGLTSWLL